MLSPRIEARQRLGLSLAMRGQLRVLALPTEQLAEEIALETAENPFLLAEYPAGLSPVDHEAAMSALPAREGLLASLAAQIALQRLTPAVEAAAIYLAGELRDDGYLDVGLDELAAETGVPIAVFEAGLAALQRCEPSGVGARTLAECLALKLADHDIAPDLARRICDRLDDFAEERWPRLTRALGIDRDEAERLARLLRGLSPSALPDTDPSPVPVQIPELIVERDPGGSLRVAVNPVAIPRLALAPLHPAARDNAPLSGLHQKAARIVSAVTARQGTLLRIGNAIVQRQARFFLRGQSSLVPDSRAAVAADLALHPSTLSRAVAGKALLFEGRVHPLSAFFWRGLPNREGHVSAFDIQMRMRAMIAREDAGAPLADAEICTNLKEEGVDIARRTVAKYRKCMRIPSSYERRRRQVSPETRPLPARDTPPIPD